jgi:hypothetical protein
VRPGTTLQWDFTDYEPWHVCPGPRGSSAAQGKRRKPDVAVRMAFDGLGRRRRRPGRTAPAAPAAPDARARRWRTIAALPRSWADAGSRAGRRQRTMRVRVVAGHRHLEGPRRAVRFPGESPSCGEARALRRARRRPARRRDAHHRGSRRGAPAHRARPARRRPAAPRRGGAHARAGRKSRLAAIRRARRA